MNVRKVAAGETISKQGQAVEHLFVLRKGKLNASVNLRGKSVEIQVMQPGQVVGDIEVLLQQQQIFTLKAPVDCEIVELTLDEWKAFFASSPSWAMLAMKSLATNALRNVQFEIKQATQDESEKLTFRQLKKHLAMLDLLFSKYGKEQLQWLELKQNCLQLFEEAPARVLRTLQILAKAGCVEIVGDPDEPEFIRVLQIRSLFTTAEYIARRMSKGEDTKLNIEPDAVMALEVLCELADSVEPSSKGVVRVSLSAFTELGKQKGRNDFSAFLIELIAARGLQMTKEQGEGEIFLSFHKAEFREYRSYWRILAKYSEFIASTP